MQTLKTIIYRTFIVTLLILIAYAINIRNKPKPSSGYEVVTIKMELSNGSIHQKAFLLKKNAGKLKIRCYTDGLCSLDYGTPPELFSINNLLGTWETLQENVVWFECINPNQQKKYAHN